MIIEFKDKSGNKVITQSHQIVCIVMPSPLNPDPKATPTICMPGVQSMVTDEVARQVIEDLIDKASLHDKA